MFSAFLSVWQDQITPHPLKLSDSICNAAFLKFIFGKHFHVKVKLRALFASIQDQPEIQWGVWK